MSKDLDNKIDSLVKSADDLLGDGADKYKKDLDELIAQVEKCNFNRATRKLIDISEDIHRGAEVLVHAKVDHPKDVEFKDLRKKISGSFRLENETIEAMKFLLNEKCSCKLK